MSKSPSSFFNSVAIDLLVAWTASPWSINNANRLWKCGSLMLIEKILTSICEVILRAGTCVDLDRRRETTADVDGRVGEMRLENDFNNQILRIGYHEPQFAASFDYLFAISSVEFWGRGRLLQHRDRRTARLSEAALGLWPSSSCQWEGQDSLHSLPPEG